jgi:hypothetical protein
MTDKQPSALNKSGAPAPSAAFRMFFKEFDAGRTKLKEVEQKTKAILIKKDAALRPIESLLKGLCTLGVQVGEGQLLSYYKKESSPTWRPGTSILLDSPSLIEIAIPNNIEKDGAIVIKVMSRDDPYAEILNRRFDTVLHGAESLAQYLGRHSISIEMDPRTEDLTKLQAQEIERRKENMNQFRQMAVHFVPPKGGVKEQGERISEAPKGDGDD